MPYLHVVAIWIALWVVFTGWGILACRLAQCDSGDAQATVIGPWIGMVFVLGVLQFWHFLAPIGSLACCAVGAVGILAAATLGFPHFRQAFRAASRQPGATALAAAFVLWLVNRSLTDQDYTDHGLYYLNAIRWISDYRIIPGLANVHDRLGFNNSNFLLHALVEPLTGRGYSAHIINGFATALTVPLMVTGFRSLMRPSADERQFGWFVLAPAMIVMLSVIDRRVSSAHPDYLAHLLITIAAWRLLAIATQPAEAEAMTLRLNLLAIASTLR